MHQNMLNNALNAQKENNARLKVRWYQMNDTATNLIFQYMKFFKNLNQLKNRST